MTAEHAENGISNWIICQRSNPENKDFITIAGITRFMVWKKRMQQS